MFSASGETCTLSCGSQIFSACQGHAPSGSSRDVVGLAPGRTLACEGCSCQSLSATNNHHNFPNLQRSSIQLQLARPHSSRRSGPPPIFAVEIRPVTDAPEHTGATARIALGTPASAERQGAETGLRDPLKRSPGQQKFPLPCVRRCKLMLAVNAEWSMGLTRHGPRGWRHWRHWGFLHRAVVVPA